MTRERIAGFLLGISVGTAVGFFLRTPEGDPETGADGKHSRWKGRVADNANSPFQYATGASDPERRKPTYSGSFH